MEIEDKLLITLSLLTFSLICVSLIKEYKIEEEIIRNSDNYVIYDNCTEIDNKYYCEIIK